MNTIACSRLSVSSEDRRKTRAGDELIPLTVAGPRFPAIFPTDQESGKGYEYNSYGMESSPSW